MIKGIYKKIVLFVNLFSIVTPLHCMGRMERRGKEEHETALREYIENCPNKILDLAGKSPDAIEAVIVDGKVKLIAVEVLSVRWINSKNIWKKNFTHAQKQESYRMFDEVKILTYKALYTKERFVPKVPKDLIEEVVAKIKRAHSKQKITS